MTKSGEFRFVPQSLTLYVYPSPGDFKLLDDDLMTITNDAFMAEIDEFLNSCDVPVFSSISEVVDEDATTQVKSNTVQPNLDLAAKRKLVRAEKDRKRRKIYHERQKRERETLKSQIIALSTLLQKVEHSKSKTDDNTVLVISWEAIAKQQQEVRLAAEAKHQQLCAAVAAKTQLIKDLSAFVNELGIFNQLQSGQVTTAARIESFDSAIYTMYMRELAALYTQTDNVFDGGRTSSKPTWRRGYYEYGDKRVLPFDFQQTCQTLWQASHMLHRQEARVQHDGVEDPENTIAVKFRITSRLKSGKMVSVMQSAVSRRYEEKDRVVIVWRSFTEGEGFFSGMNSDETGWCVLKRSTNFLQTGTELEICVRDVPMHLNFTASDEKATDEQFTGFVFSAKTENYTEIVNILEKLNIVNP